MLYWDGAPAKLWYDGCAKTTELVGCAIRGVLSAEETREIAPTLSRPLGRSSAGILGAIRWIQFKRKYLDPLTADGKWKFLHICVDSAAVNIKTVRCIIAETAHYKRLLVTFSPCFSHVLSLVVKWGLGKDFEYGCLLRVWGG